MQMKLKAPDVYFQGPLIAMKADVIQALINLDRMNDSNWIKVKEWIQKEHDQMLPNAAYSVGINEALSNAYKGMVLAMGGMCFYITEPVMALKQHQMNLQKMSSVIPKNPGGNNPQP